MPKWIKYLIFFFPLVFFTFLTQGGDTIELKKIAQSEIQKDMVISGLKSLTVDKQGNVFCLSVKECTILKFSPDLKFLTQFGRNGKGPGEFGTDYVPTDDRISINGNGDVYVSDYNPVRFIVFDDKGKYKQDINLQREYHDILGHLSNPRIVNNRVFTARHKKAAEPFNAAIFYLNPFEIKVQIPIREERIFVKQGGIYVMGIKKRYYGDNYKIVADNEKVVFADSQRYRLQVFNNKGNKLFEIEDDRMMSRFKNRELDKIKKEYQKLKTDNPALFKKFIAQVRDRKNVIADIKLSTGKIWMFPVREDITVGDRYPVVIYDLKGKIIGKGVFKKLPVWIWKNYAFFIEEDDEDNPVIFKYKLKDF